MLLYHCVDPWFAYILKNTQFAFACAGKFILELEKIPRKAGGIIWNGKHLLYKKQLCRLWLLSWEKLSRKIMIGIMMAIRKQLWAVLSATRTADPQMELVGARFRTNNKGNGSLCITYLTSWNICQRMPYNYRAFIWSPFIQQVLGKRECGLGLGQSYESICPDLLFDDYRFGALIKTWKKETQSHCKMNTEKEIMLQTNHIQYVIFLFL